MAAVDLTDLQVTRVVVNHDPDGASSSDTFTLWFEGKTPTGATQTLVVSSTGADFPLTNAEWDTWYTTNVRDPWVILNFDPGATPPYTLYDEGP
jgi:hypothetical protein